MPNQAENFSVTARAGAGAAAVPSHGRRLIPKLPASGTQPPGDINVVPIHENIFIQHLAVNGGVLQGRAAVQRRRTVKAPNFRRLGILTEIFFVLPQGMRSARIVKTNADRIDSVNTPVIGIKTQKFTLGARDAIIQNNSLVNPTQIIGTDLEILGQQPDEI